jgi:subtilisin-like proprotein convertase family protein
MARVDCQFPRELQLKPVGITTSIATVSGVGIIGNGCVFIDNVTIDLTHTFVGDIAIFVIAPGGQGTRTVFQ